VRAANPHHARTRRGRRQTVAGKKHPAVSNYYPIRGVPACVRRVCIHLPLVKAKYFSLFYKTDMARPTKQTGYQEAKTQCTQRHGLHPVYFQQQHCHHYQNGDVISCISWPSGFKGAKKGTPLAAQTAAESAARQIDQGMRRLR